MTHRGDRRGHTSAAAWVIAAALAASAGHLPAQADAPEDAPLSVFVPDSSVAAERFALAEKLQAAREWSKAAEIYQELLDGYRDRVVPAGAGPEWTGGFVSVAERVVRQISEWPAEGIAAYNGRYQPAALDLLQSAEGSDDLRKLVDRYLFTQAGRTAALRLVQSYWQDGDVSSAARLAQRVAAMLPSDRPERAQLLMQAGLGWHLAGVPARAQEALASLREQHPGATGVIAGEEVNLAEQLGRSLQSPPRVHRVADAWQSFGGPPDRAEVPDFGGRSDALLFSVETAGAGVADASTAQFRSTLNQTLGVYPVYDRRQLFFQDGINLHAVSIDGGMRLAGWPGTSVALAPALPNMSMIRTLALAPDSVYAALSDVSAQQWVPDVSENSSLICVDRQNGQIRWRVTPANLAESHPTLKATQFASPPLVVDDRVYVAARGGRNAQFHDIYALCFDRHAGKLLWASYVASGPNINMLLLDDFAISSESGLPHLSFSAQRLFVVTNVGVVAALEASDGTPAWLRVYPRIEAPPARGGMRALMRAQAGAMANRIFASSPAIISGGKVFALPVDAKHLLAIDENDGRVIRQIPRASLGNVDTLVGLAGPNAVLAGERVATALDWAKAAEDAAQQRDAINWTMEFPGNALRGRPFLTADSLFLPTDERLLRVATDKWKIEQTTPPHPGTWELGQGPGNVLVTDEHVVIATNQRVNVYTNLSAATARLDREVERAPESLEPLVRYGELLFAAGKYAASLEKLSAALNLARRGNPAHAEVDRLFGAALTAASRAATLTTDRSVSSDFLAIAKGAITSPVQAVQYHLTTALLELRGNNGPASLAALQAILEDPEQRVVLQREGEFPRRFAGDIARRQVIQLIDRFGPAVYSPVEQKSRGRLAEAMSRRDPAALMEVALSFPNSTAAPDALLAAGRIHEEARRLNEAASMYRMLVQDYASDNRAPEYVEAMARVYAAIPGKAPIAAGRLAHAAALHGDPATRMPIRLPGGQSVPPGKFSQVSLAIREAAGMQRSRPLPDFRLPSRGPSPFADPRVIDLAAERILSPLPGQLPNAQKSVVLLPEGQIAVLAHDGELLARFDDAQITLPADFLWLSPTHLCIRSGRQLTVLDLSTRAIAWRMNPEQLPAVQQIEDLPEVIVPEANAGDPRMNPAIARARLIAQRQIRPEPVDGILDLAGVTGKVIVGTGTGRIAAFDAASGSLIWQIRPETGRIAQLTATDDFTAVRIMSPRRSVLICIDNDTGRLIYSRSHAPEEAIQNILLSDDGQLIFTLPSRLASKDLFDQSERLLFDTAMPNPAAFTAQEHADQLVLSGDKIVASTENGRSVRLFSRFTGKQLSPGGDETSVDAAVLPPQARSSRTRLVPADPYIYAHNQTTLCAINVQRVETPDRSLPETVQNLKAVLPGRSHLVAVEQPFRQGNNPTVPEILFLAFSRNATANGESGRLDHNLVIRHTSGISSWQMLEGGLLMTTGDKRLLYYPAGR